MEARSRRRRGRGANDVPLDGARAARLDQLAAYGAQQGVRDGRQTKRAVAAEARQGEPQQGVVPEPREELGVVVVEREYETQLLDPGLVGCAELDDSVRLLPGAAAAAGGEGGDEWPRGEAPRRVSRETRRDPEREG